MEGPGYLFDPTAGSPAAGVWTALALFALAFIICIVRRKRKKKKAEGDRYCPQCGEKLSGSAAFCRRCGCRLDPAGRGERRKKRRGRTGLAAGEWLPSSALSSSSRECSEQRFLQGS